MASTGTTSLIQGADSKRDPRAATVVAKSIYRELVDGDFTDQEVIAVAGELLALVTRGVRERRGES